MIHHMKLYDEYFELLKNGSKKIEVRLNDEKRRKIQVGHIIEFTKLPEKDETLKCQVINLQSYETFLDMYESMPFESFGCEGWTMEEMLEGTYEIYTVEQEKQWGTLAITLSRMR